jgi:hypothetical protein
MKLRMLRVDYGGAAMIRDVLWVLTTICFLAAVFFAGLVALWLLPFVLLFMVLTRRY